MNRNAHRNVLKIGILALAPLAIPQSMLNPVLPAIQAAFPNVAPSIIQLLSTIPSLCCVAFSPIYGKLTDFVTRRKILFTDMVLCGVGLALVVPGVLTRIPSMVAPAAATMAMSIFYAASGLGQFVQPLVFAWIQKQLGITDFRQAFIISMAGLLILLVYMFMDAITYKEPKAQQAESK
jgi:MFS family permease